MRPEFPELIDSSMLSYFKSCMRKGYYAHMLHMKPQRESVHLLAGKAFATGLEVARKAFYGEGKSQDQAVIEGTVALIQEWGEFQPDEKDKKQLDVMMGVLTDYFIQYPMETDHIQPMYYSPGKPAVEFSFALPLPVNHPETGSPILFVGRADMVGILKANNGLYGVDEKTSTALGAWWTQQWELRSQFSAYTWALQEHGIPAKGVIVRGVGILAAQFTYAEVISDRPAWMVHEWYGQIIKDLERMKSQWAKGEFDADFSDSCAAYGGCPFRGVCGTSPQNRELVLQSDFVRRKWNPVSHLEEEITGETQ